MGSENGPCATISTVRAFGYGTPEKLDTRFKLNFYADTVMVDGDTVRLDNGQPLVYMPLNVAIDLTTSPYIKTAGARMAKYEIDRHSFLDGKLQDNDIVLYRYADVLLMLAEAKVRNGQSVRACQHARPRGPTYWKNVGLNCCGKAGEGKISYGLAALRTAMTCATPWKKKTRAIQPSSPYLAEP